MLRVSKLLLLAGLLLPAAWPQQSYPFFSPSPAPPLLVTATANSPFGQSSYCYWVVVVYPIGKSTPSAPSCLSNAIETSSVLISWSAAQGASSYDVLRTTTPILPNVTSSIAVATAVSGTTQTDSFGALSSYTITSAVPATANLYLDNTAFSTPQLRAVITGVGGTSSFNLGSGGGGTPGGSSGQVQYNNSGAFGGFTVSGDATLNTGTGVLTVTQVNGAAVPASAKLISTNASSRLVAAAAETAPITVSATGGIACGTCATTTNGGALSGTSPVTISAAGVIACATCATTTNGGALSGTSPVTISAAGVIACATCATTTNGGALSGTAPITVSAAGAVGVNISANLQVSGSNLDTIQGIQTTSTPQFLRLGLNQAADSTSSLAATQTALGTTSTDGYILQNTTAAANNAQQFSPRIHWSGRGWKTQATAASQSADWIAEIEPGQSQNHPDDVLIFQPIVNGAVPASSKIGFCYSDNFGQSPILALTGLDGAGGNGCGGVSGWSGFGSVNSGNLFGVYINNTEIKNFSINGEVWGAARIVAWNSSASPTNNNTGDTGLCRSGAAVLGVNDGSTTCTNYRDIKLRTDNQTGLTALYNNVSTTGMGLPPIYATVASTGQTASIGTTNLQCGGAVCPAGKYRVTVYDVVTTTGTGTLTSTIGWNDGTAARTQTSAGVATTATNFEQVQYTIKADGVNNITYATTLSVSGTYSIYIDLERLQ